MILASDLRVTGTESARDVMHAMPGDFNPRDYVSADHYTPGAVTMVASYTPVGHGVASVASRQYIDAQARRALPGARLVSERDARTYGAFQWGAVIRTYSTQETNR